MKLVLHEGEVFKTIHPKAWEAVRKIVNAHNQNDTRLNVNEVLATRVSRILNSTATSATAGASGAVPAQVLGYFSGKLDDGTPIRIPYFAP